MLLADCFGSRGRASELKSDSVAQRSFCLIYARRRQTPILRAPAKIQPKPFSSKDDGSPQKKNSRRHTNPNRRIVMLEDPCLRQAKASFRPTLGRGYSYGLLVFAFFLSLRQAKPLRFQDLSRTHQALLSSGPRFPFATSRRAAAVRLNRMNPERIVFLR